MRSCYLASLWFFIQTLNTSAGNDADWALDKLVNQIQLLQGLNSLKSLWVSKKALKNPM